MAEQKDPVISALSSLIDRKIKEERSVVSRHIETRIKYWLTFLKDNAKIDIPTALIEQISKKNAIEESRKAIEFVKSIIPTIKDGKDGVNGKDARQATISVAETKTLQPGQEAYVKNIGTETDAKLVFGIPQSTESAKTSITGYNMGGPRGKRGEKGDRGDQFVYIQDSDPGLQTSYVWFQTENGSLKTLWINTI